jgi:hypothetical protein
LIETNVVDFPVETLVRLIQRRRRFYFLQNFLIFFVSRPFEIIKRRDGRLKCILKLALIKQCAGNAGGLKLMKFQELKISARTRPAGNNISYW